MKGSTWVVLAIGLCTAAGAEARWEDWKAIPKATDPDDFLVAVDALSPRLIFLGGVQVKMTGGMFPTMKAVLYRSQDAGGTVQTIAGGLTGPMGAAVSAVAMRDLQRGIVALGSDLFVTGTGTTWRKVTPPDIGKGEVQTLAWVGPETAVAVGAGGGAWRTTDGGESWTKVETGSRVDLGCLFFLDGRQGWAAGAVEEETETEEMQTLLSYPEVAVLQTADGGQRWTEVVRIPADSKADGEGGKLACPIFFLPDGQTGFLALSRYDVQKGRAKEALLYRTTDGGRTWRDTQTDFQVGTLNLFMKVPIYVSYLAGMYWQDADHGHLVGAADTGLSASSGGGGDQPVYRSVDMTTQDGGRTWDRTDIGELSFQMGSGTVPQGDPRPVRARFLDWYTAWLVGEKGSVWQWDYKCIKQSQCLPGYQCEKREGDEHPRCYPATGTGEDAGGEPGGEVAGDGDVAPIRDAWAGDEASGTDLVWLPDAGGCTGPDCQESGKGGGGCRMAPAPVGRTGAFGLMLLAAVLVLWVRRRKSGA